MKKEIIETGKKVALTASAIIGVSKILSVLLRVAQKDPGVINKFFKVTGGVTGLLGGIGMIWLFVKNKNEESQYKSNRMADADLYTLQRMADQTFQTTRSKTNRHDTVDDVDLTADEELGEEENRVTWIKAFKEKFKMPSLPIYLEVIMRGVPLGYEEPMLLHLLDMFGSMCFSKVRALYSDGILHAPNLQVIVEGNWGSGKGKFEQIFKTLFKRVIDRCKALIEKMGSESDNQPSIIQTTGIGTSMTRYVDILAANQGCHMYMFNSEVKALSYDLRRGNGLNFDFLRKAFENGDVCRNSRGKEGKNGIFPVFLNYTITGTPNDITNTFKKELEGGTISRIAWTCIPEAECSPGVLHLPEGDDLESLRDQIDLWADQYCFKTSAAGDVAVDEVTIDLGYVCTALNQWNKAQYELSLKENNPARKVARTRVATIAFHCAIVLHMLYECPTDARGKKAVVDLTIFIANYCIERFLHKFGKEQNEQSKKNQEAELVDRESDVTVENSAHDSELLKTNVEKLKALHDIKDEKGISKYGWDTLAKMTGMSSSTIKRKVRDYEAGLKG